MNKREIFKRLTDLIPMLETVNEDTVHEIMLKVHKTYFNVIDDNEAELEKYDIYNYHKRIDEMMKKYNLSKDRELYFISPEKLDFKDTIFLFSLTMSMARWDDGEGIEYMIMNGCMIGWLRRLDELCEEE